MTLRFPDGGHDIIAAAGGRLQFYALTATLSVSNHLKRK